LAPALRDRVRFIYPAAPLDLEDLGIPGGRAWWNIDLMRLQETIAAGRGRELLDQSPASLPAVREQFLRFLQECAAETGIPLKRTVIGGFSQGSMLTTDVALHLAEPPAGLIILSGMLMNQAIWEQQLQKRSGLAVFQSHGRFDPLLPFDFACGLRDLLKTSGNTVEFSEFSGAHEIPYEVLQQAAAFVQRCLTRLTT
jgi:phospholipase/carboxylesterase